MRIVLVGGTGVFGARLAELLVRAGHDIWIAARGLERANALAAQLGAHAISADLTGDLSRIFTAAPQLVIDAAGPFQDYGGDAEETYRLARACIAHGVHYLDLADASKFVSGIGVLDAQAKSAGVWVLSGASSVPGLSSCVVQKLSAGLTSIDLIESGIYPGNRAPRGRSVIASIVQGVGAPMRLWRGARWTPARGWQLRKDETLTPTLQRSGYIVDVPDLALFPDFFKARSVIFRAGLELGVMNASLAILSGLRRWRPLKFGKKTLSALLGMANLLRPFGSDVGGMRVTVTGTKEPRGLLVRRRWTLLAKDGDGPYIPGIIARAIARSADKIAPGARPCLAELPLSDVEAAFSDLAIETSVDEQRFIPLFEEILGTSWGQLPGPIKDSHTFADQIHLTGKAKVTRGKGLIPGLIAAIFGFPPTCAVCDVCVTKTRMHNGSEIWQRDFGGRIFKSRLSKGVAAKSNSLCVRERFGPFTFEIALKAEKSAIVFPVRRGWFLRIPMPRILLPQSQSREYSENGRFHFDVSLFAPLGLGLVVKYQGSLTPA